MIDRGQAAEGQQRLHAVLEAVFLRDVLDALELHAAARGRIGLDQDAVQPRLLADDGAHLVAGIDADIGARPVDLLPANLGDALLVRGIDVGEDGHDADGIDAVGDQLLRRLVHLVLVERQHDVAELVDALGDAVGAAARHQRIGMRVGDGMQPVGIGVVGPGLQPAPHQDHVLQALGGDEAELSPRTRQQRVQHAGAGIEHHVDAGEQRLQRDTPGVRRILGRGKETLRLVLRRRRRLADLEVPVLVDEDGVGHCAAGIDADDDRLGFRGLGGDLVHDGVPYIGSVLPTG